jgi:hypothetical protein
MFRVGMTLIKMLNKQRRLDNHPMSLGKDMGKKNIEREWRLKMLMQTTIKKHMVYLRA